MSDSGNSDGLGAAALLRAVEYAVGAHNGTYRKSRAGEPYVVHPLRVARVLAEQGYDDVALLQAAVLHDVVEDTGTPLSEIETVFGAEVALYVGQVSDNKELTQVERKRAQVEHISTISYGAAAIKLADAYDNLSDMIRNSPPRGWSVEKIQGYVVWKATVASKVARLYPDLDKLLAPIFAGTFSFNGAVHPAIPSEPDRETQLAAYYRLLEDETAKKAVCQPADGVLSAEKTNQ